MTSIHADLPQEAYALARRYTSKRGRKPLKGFALDLTVRFNSDGVPFLQDHNGDLGTMPFHNVDEFKWSGGGSHEALAERNRVYNCLACHLNR